MALSKKTVYLITDKILLTAFALIPFGQFLKININFFGRSINILPIDLAVFLILTFNFRNISLTLRTRAIIAILIFSQILQFFLIGTNTILGLFYLFRFIAYAALFDLNIPKLDKKIYKKLLIVIFVTAILGLVQYFIFPDLRFLKDWGWDEHRYRLAGTYLDPAFIGIILVFGVLLAIELKENFIKIIFLLVTLALTYSRASYLALILGLGVYAFMAKGRKTYIKKLNTVLFAIVIFLILIIIIPKNREGAGVDLKRTSTILQRATNYQQSLAILKSNPVFGIGFNNLCYIKTHFLKVADASSHSCSGTDASILTILTTVGITGFFIFVYWIWGLIKNNPKDAIFVSSMIATLIHSNFSNTLFYPFVLFILATMFLVAKKKAMDSR